MLASLKHRYKLRKFQKKWRLLNPHNSTVAASVFEPDKVSIGNYTYGELFVRDYYYSNERLEMGSFCSIAAGVKFFLAGNHFMERPTMYPVNRFCRGQKGADGYSKGPIVVGSDVWIGYDAWFFSGVTIGQGAVIGARSLIVKDVPPYSVVGGNPGRVIRHRFSNDIIDQLLRIDYSRVTMEMLSKHVDFLSKPLELSQLLAFLNDIPCHQSAPQ